MGAIIGGLFFLVPFLWVMKYDPVHTYQLTPMEDNQEQVIPTKVAPANTSQNKSKVERLRELKQLLDEKIITQEEFEKEKAKILNEDD